MAALTARSPDVCLASRRRQRRGRDVDGADDFINMQNHHEFKVYYQSGKQTVSSLDVNLNGHGRYVFVVSNAHSLFTSKTVQVQSVQATCSD